LELVRTAIWHLVRLECKQHDNVYANNSGQY
jgi:hypothetical protein